MQPAHDLGLQAAQLLLSRLEAPARLEPRRVVLPVRLIVRRSCGSGGSALSLPLAAASPEQSYEAPPPPWAPQDVTGSASGHPFTNAKEV